MRKDNRTGNKPIGPGREQGLKLGVCRCPPGDAGGKQLGAGGPVPCVVNPVLVRDYLSPISLTMISPSGSI